MIEKNLDRACDDWTQDCFAICSISTVLLTASQGCLLETSKAGTSNPNNIVRDTMLTAATSLQAYTLPLSGRRSGTHE